MSQETARTDRRSDTQVFVIGAGPAGLFAASELLGAGGGHSVTRHSMQEHLDGETYGGRFIVADIRLTLLPAPPGRARIIVGRSGFVLLAPLPEGRLLLFVNRDEHDQRAEPPSAADLAALVNARIGIDAGLLRLALDLVLPDAQARRPSPWRRQALSGG